MNNFAQLNALKSLTQLIGYGDGVGSRHFLTQTEHRRRVTVIESYFLLLRLRTAVGSETTAPT